jgi:hypothetical protein
MSGDNYKTHHWIVEDLPNDRADGQKIYCSKCGLTYEIDNIYGIRAIQENLTYLTCDEVIMYEVLK